MRTCLLLATILLVLQCQIAEARSNLILCCNSSNDVYRVLKDNKVPCSRFDNPLAAVLKAPNTSGVLILADGYPKSTTVFISDILRIASKKNLRLYVEYPSSLPGIQLDQPRRKHVERGVISSDSFNPNLKKLDILVMHDCTFLPVKDVTTDQSDIVLAKVAGFDTAVYGMPAKTFPVLFEHDGIFVATTKLSQFVTARYSPQEAWKTIWEHIIGWVQPGESALNLKWTPSVRPSYGLNDTLPNDIEMQTLRRSYDWFKRTYQKIDKNYADKPHGFPERYDSTVYMDGSQPLMDGFRHDCTAEAGITLALLSKMFNDEDFRQASEEMCDYIYFTSNLTAWRRKDPNCQSYGLAGMYNDFTGKDTAGHLLFTDDQSRGTLAAAAAGATLKSDRWDEPIASNLLGSFRTTGVLGFRGPVMLDSTLERNGWRMYYVKSSVFMSPHHEALAWAYYLWGYHKTGFQPFLDRAKTAIQMTMEGYPDKWKWNNGLQQERAKMLLALAWLVRVEDTLEHRKWLRFMADEMLADQDKSGAIRERFGPPGPPHTIFATTPPLSNDYDEGSEASLIVKNGDPVADLLYTNNFALLSFHEAAAATGEPYYSQVEDKIAKFICRSQIRSEAHPELDGAWFRGIDLKRWEYWASTVEEGGWGAWCIESGWTQTWIASVLSMRQMKTSLWDLVDGSTIDKPFHKLRPSILPDEMIRLGRTDVYPSE